MTQRFCIVIGNPLSGLSVIGPFDSQDEAAEHAERESLPENWLITRAETSKSDATDPPLDDVEARCTRLLVDNSDLRKEVDRLRAALEAVDLQLRTNGTVFEGRYTHSVVLHALHGTGD